MTKVLKATISGSFIASDKQTESFDNVVGYLPALDDDKAQQMIIRRYAKIWIGQAMKKGEPAYKRVGRVREVFVDSVEEEEGKQLSYVGKDIMEMNFEEIQDLAAAKDLAGIPLYKTGSLTTARRVAFSQYAIHVLGMDDKDKNNRYVMDSNQAGFNPNNYGAIKADETIRRSTIVAHSVQESIDRELLREELKEKTGAAPKAESPLNIEQLKAIAKAKGVEFAANIGFKQLYARVYPAAAA